MSFWDEMINIYETDPWHNAEVVEIDSTRDYGCKLRALAEAGDRLYNLHGDHCATGCGLDAGWAEAKKKAGVE